jgi:hypothetical protein
MSDSTHRGAPDPYGEIVPGTPPVPLTVWHVPAPARSRTLSLPLAQRLVAGFTHRHDLVLDLTTGPALPRAAMSARRRLRRHTAARLQHGEESAALLVAPWPPGVDPAQFLTGCAGQLRPGGHAALIIATGQVTIHQRLIAAGHTAGLAYLQHYIAAHELRATGTRLTIRGQHLRVHTDVVILSRPATTDHG